MVIEISNKTSSSSTCVLVRMVLGGGIPQGWRQEYNSDPVIPFFYAPGPTILLLPSPCACYVLLGHKGEPAG